MSSIQDLQLIYPNLYQNPIKFAFFYKKTDAFTPIYCDNPQDVFVQIFKSDYSCYIVPNKLGWNGPF